MAEIGELLTTPPIGWYVAAFSSDLAAGQLHRSTLAGRELLLFRTSSGLVAADAHCPHLGADLGDGEVDGDELVCPFHHFRFDARGDCTATGQGGAPPPGACLRLWPCQEKNGLILVFHHPERAAPTWEVPTWSDSGELRNRSTLTLASHPQEVSENSVDLGHFSAVHGYANVRALAPPRLQGPLLETRYSMQLADGRFGSTRGPVDIVFHAHVYGLGVSMVDVHVAGIGLRSRALVLPTPTAAGQLTLRLSMVVQEMQSPAALHPWLSILPTRIAAEVVDRIAFRTYVAEVRADFSIWQNKRHLRAPALTTGDRAIGLYRHWARQFYLDDAVPAAGD